MMTRNVLLLILLFVLSQSIAQTRKESKSLNFSSYQTFTTSMGELIVPKDERTVTDEQFYEWMKTSIVRELELRGYQYIQDSTAHLTISYVAGAFNVTKNEDMGPMGGTPASDAAQTGQSRYWSQSYRQGMLVLEVYKGQSKDILWSNESNVDLTNINVERAVSAVVTKALKKFPKKPKSK